MTTTHDTYVTRRYRDGWIHSSVNRSTGKPEYRAQLESGKVIPVRSQCAAEMAINAVTK